MIDFAEAGTVDSKRIQVAIARISDVNFICIPTLINGKDIDSSTFLAIKYYDVNDLSLNSESSPQVLSRY